MKCFKLCAAVVATVLSIAPAASAQMLAHPGWAGNGMNRDAWWRNAVLVRVSDPAALDAASFNQIQSLGVDALVVNGADSQAEMDALDAMVREASSHAMRVMVEQPLLATSAEMEAKMRFWYARGMAGMVVRVDGTAASDPATVTEMAELRRTNDRFAGQRFLMLRVPENVPGALANTVQQTVITLPAPLTPEALRALMPKLASDAHAMIEVGEANGAGTNDQALTLAAVALTEPGGVLLPSDTASHNATHAEWYRTLLSLRRSNYTVRHGELKLMDAGTPDAFMWMRRPPAAGFTHPPILFACNLSGHPITLQLARQVKALGLKGTFMHALARTDGGMGGLDLDAVTLPAYGVFIGEVKF